MAFHRPIPESKLPPAQRESGSASLAETGKLMQIPYIMLSAVVVGWLLGAGADRLFHQKWIMLTGIGFGCVAGLYSAVKMALDSAKVTQPGDDAQPSTGESDKIKDGAGDGKDA